MMPRNCWAILTGEYPPEVGGVAGYTAILARELAKTGDEVHVWTPKPCELEQEVIVHPLANNFGLSSLARLQKELRQLPKHYRLLVQYVPQAFGCKAMNLPLCQWIAQHAKSHHVWVMFHEVCFPKYPNEPLKHWLLRQANVMMARLLTSSAERVFVSIPFWGPVLNQLTGQQISSISLPVSSNMPTMVEPDGVEMVRREFGFEPGSKLFGYFGTCSSSVWELLGPVFLELLNRRAENKVLLLGSGGLQSRSKLLHSNKHLANQIIAPGVLSDVATVNHIAACDVLLYPFPDGVSGRRTSLLAGLGLGMPIVTNIGQLSEPFWRDSRAVALIDRFDKEEIVNLAENLASNKQWQAQLKTRALSLYKEVFDIENTVAILRK